MLPAVGVQRIEEGERNVCECRRQVLFFVTPQGDRGESHRCSRTCIKRASHQLVAVCVQESNDEGNESTGSNGKDKLAELESELAVRPKGRTMRTGPKKKKTKAVEGAPKKGKKMTKWEDSKLSKKEIQELDRSKEVRLDALVTWLASFAHQPGCVLAHGRRRGGSDPREA